MTSSAYSADPGGAAPVRKGVSILALDASSASGSIALSIGEDLVSELNVENAGPHSAWLLPAVSAFLSDSGCTAGDIDIYAATVGPGSFTGIRIAVSTVKGLAWPLGKKVYGASTLKALAMNCGAPGATICPLLDARKGEVYAALFSFSGEGMKALMDESVLTPGELFANIERLAPGPVTFTGPGLAVYGDEVLKNVTGADAAPEQHWRVKASNVALLALRDTPNATAPGLLSPVYLRKPGTEFKKAAKYK